jgi:hypothetical protein
MRVTIENPEPGFSDARVAIQPKKGEKIILRGGESHTFIIDSGMDNQLFLQALRRGKETKK